MLTDINGLRPAFYGMAARMADLGYVVLLPDIYHRSGQFPHFDHVPSSRDPNDRPKILEMGALMTAPAQLEDGGAWVDYLTALPDVKGKIGVVGYCLTGPSAVYTAAARPDKVGAAATFHGVKLATEAPDSPHTFLPKIKAAVYFGHATNDQTCPPEMIAKLEAEMKKVGTKGESVTYPSNHGFAVNGSPNYDEASSEKHWAVLTKLFKENL
jgi:carboxymethylenebutenolidase